MLVTSAFCMLGAVAAQAAPYVCYEGKDGGGPNAQIVEYLTYQVRPEGPLSGGREAREFGSPMQKVYSVFGRTGRPVGVGGAPATPVMGVITEARDTQAQMYFSSAAIVYSCLAEDEISGPEASATPTTWFCNIDINTAPGSPQVRVFTQVDPSEVEDCSFYPEP
jgi:hypothetical protein